MPESTLSDAEKAHYAEDVSERKEGSVSPLRRCNIIVAVLVLLLAAAAVGTWSVTRPSESRIVEIVQDGEVLQTIDLDAAEDQTIVVEYSDVADSADSADAAVSAGSNTIEISGEGIRVREADCPDQTCVKMGKLYSESLPIVCLPHKLIIRFKTE